MDTSALERTLTATETPTLRIHNPISAALPMSRNRGAVPSVGGGLPYPRSVFLARVDPGVRGAIIATPTMSIFRHSN